MIKLKKIDCFNNDKSSLWGQIEDAFRRSAPKTMIVDDDMIDRLCSAIVFGDIDVLSLTDENGLAAIILTIIREDSVLESRVLLIYAGAAFRKLTWADWAQCIEGAMKYASDHKCKEITGFSLVPKVYEMAARVGGNINTRFFSIPVEVK
jgi:hypothetical protein